MGALRSIGRYQLHAMIGSGAMGEIYEAHDPVIDRRIAIKVVRRELIARHEDSAGWLDRFRQEARAAGRLLHSNIVTLLDYGEEAGAPFLAMEFVEGDPLDVVLKRCGRLGEQEAIAVMTQVLAALEFAHSNGVIHRDVKPANILLVKTGLVKITDFGIARLDSSDLTLAGDVLGTPSYMSPEQLAGRTVDRRADLFAAGAVFFELLSGERPFGKGLAEIITNMERRGPVDIRTLNPEVNPALKAVIETALALDPERRHASAAEFSRAIAEARSKSSLPLGGALASSGGEATVVSPIAAAQPSRGASDPPNEPAFQSDLLAEVERDLATVIGPMARIVVQRSARTVRSLTALYEALAGYIEDEADREEFLRSGEARLRALRSRSGAEPASRNTSQHDALPFEMPAAIAPEALRRVELALTRYIGPIARVVLRQQLRKSNSLSELYRDLAVHIPNERDRALFLASGRK